MSLTAIQRARIILDLLKDGIVADEANYGPGIDKVPLPVASRYGDTFLKESGKIFYDTQTPPQPRAPTNDEIAGVLLQRLRQYVVGEHVHQRIRADVPATTKASRAAAEAETLADIGE